MGILKRFLGVTFEVSTDTFLKVSTKNDLQYREHAEKL